MKKWITIAVLFLLWGCSQEAETPTPYPAPGPERLTPSVAPITRAVENPDGPQTPASILDTIDPEECNLVHNINACFTSGRPPEHTPVGEYLELFILARDDLSQRFDLNPGSIKIQMIEPVNWDDTSLGNPEPGMTYSQVIVPGFNILLEAEGQVYEYHTSRDRVVFVESR